MQNVDASNLVKFQTQFTKRVGDLNGDGKVDIKDKMIGCCKACKIMIWDAGLQTKGAYGRIDIMVYDTAKNLTKAHTNQKGIDILDASLNEGLPVLIGVNRSNKYVKNANAATNHFVLVVERYTENEITKYRFFDPGTSHEDLGTSKQNVLTLNDGVLTGTTAYKSGYTYVVTEVRPTSLKSAK